jgi:hypothetical protein
MTKAIEPAGTEMSRGGSGRVEVRALLLAGKSTAKHVPWPGVL